MKVTNQILAILFFGGLLSSFTSSNSRFSPINEKPYLIVGQMPHFPGGKLAMNRYIAEHLTYPFDALKNKIQGKVNVEFVVDKEGTLTEIKTVGKKLGYGLEEQAIKIFKAMPKWVPGRQDGVVVPVYMMIPIIFTL